MLKNRPRRVTALLAAILLSACVVFSGALLPAYAMEAPVLSDTDVSGTEVDPHFKRVSMIPLNVDIPYFYQEVANVSGMYIFIMPDGTVYKRIFGALDGEYGWYEPEGYDYKVVPGSPIIDTDDDVVLYEEALEAAGIIKEYTSDYYGILPPEQGTVSVNALFGRPAILIFIISGALTAVICLSILAASRNRKKPPPGQEH